MQGNAWAPDTWNSWALCTLTFVTPKQGPASVFHFSRFKRSQCVVPSGRVFFLGLEADAAGARTAGAALAQSGGGGGGPGGSLSDVLNRSSGCSVKVGQRSPFLVSFI